MSAPTTIGAITQARPSRPRYGPMIPDPKTQRPMVMVGGGPWHDPLVLINTAVHRRKGNGLSTLVHKNVAFLTNGGAEELRRLAAE